MYVWPSAPLTVDFRGDESVVLYFAGIENLHSCTGEKIEICREQVSLKSINNTWLNPNQMIRSYRVMRNEFEDHRHPQRNPRKI